MTTTANGIARAEAAFLRKLGACRQQAADRSPAPIGDVVPTIIRAASTPSRENTPGAGATSAVSLLATPHIRIRPEVPESERDFGQIPPVLLAAIRACASRASRWPLFIFGGVGVGKSMAVLALCDRVAGPCIYRDFLDVCGEHQDAKLGRLRWHGTHAETLVSPAAFWQDWRRAELCAVDEIGARATVTDHQYETLKRAVDTRHGFALVLISNIDLDRLARVFDDRIASRCAAGTVVRVEGPDRRLGYHRTVVASDT